MEELSIIILGRASYDHSVTKVKTVIRTISVESCGPNTQFGNVKSQAVLTGSFALVLMIYNEDLSIVGGCEANSILTLAFERCNLAALVVANDSLEVIVAFNSLFDNCVHLVGDHTVFKTTLKESFTLKLSCSFSLVIRACVTVEVVNLCIVIFSAASYCKAVTEVFTAVITVSVEGSDPSCADGNVNLEEIFARLFTLHLIEVNNNVVSVFADVVECALSVLNEFTG